MDNSHHQLYSNTLNRAEVPEQVYTLCDGLLKINSDFFEFHLLKLLNDFESILFKHTESGLKNESHSDHFAHLRNLKRTRHDFIPRFLAGIEHQIAGIRKSATRTDSNLAADSFHHSNMGLVDPESFDETQIQFDISSRCESQNSFDIFLLGQRFGVLAGQPAFGAADLPIGPRKLCKCLQEAIQSLNLDASNTKQIYYLFERHILTNFSELLFSCNTYLIANGVLSNLTYVPFRNPELRHKKSPLAANETPQQSKPVTQFDTALGGAKILDFKPVLPEPKAQQESSINLEENFSQLRLLLAKRKQLLNKLSSFSSTYIGDANPRTEDGLAISHASPEVIKSIIKNFQENAVDHPNNHSSIQHLKHDLLAQLRNQSTNENELTLAEEDSDAIDMVSLVMDNALKDISPNSIASQLISMMQTPLMHVVLQDKSFFSNHIHPARQLLNIIAETGFNWLDESTSDDTLHMKVSSIVNKTVKNFDGDNQELIDAYEETNSLLQALIKKAESAERRQIEAVRGKERLTIARSRAASIMDELTKLQDIPPIARTLLNKAWTDVMALTELRNGSDSDTWSEQKAIAERIIAIHEANAPALDKADSMQLRNKIQQALSLVGYHHEEAKNITDNLIVNETDDKQVNSNIQLPEKIRFGENTQSANIPVYDLTEDQLQIVEQIKFTPVGTWFEFIHPDSGKTVRRKMSWQSHITHNILFVNQRGQKTSEIFIEALAIEISEGRARIQIIDKRTVIERAFENVLHSLRSLIPGMASKKND